MCLCLGCQSNPLLVPLLTMLLLMLLLACVPILLLDAPALGVPVCAAAAAQWQRKDTHPAPPQSRQQQGHCTTVCAVAQVHKAAAQSTAAAASNQGAAVRTACTCCCGGCQHLGRHSWAAVSSCCGQWSSGSRWCWCASHQQAACAALCLGLCGFCWRQGRVMAGQGEACGGTVGVPCCCQQQYVPCPLLTAPLSFCHVCAPHPICVLVCLLACIPPSPSPCSFLSLPFKQPTDAVEGALSSHSSQDLPQAAGQQQLSPRCRRRRHQQAAAAICTASCC